MFIKLEEDIIEVVLQRKNTKERERAIDVIVQLMTSSRMNYHKIYMESSLDREKESIIKKAIDENSWREFLYLQKQRIDFDGFVELLDIYAVITKSKHCSRVGKILYINPFEAMDFDLSTATYIAGENQRDGLFYQKISDFFRKEYRFLNLSIYSKRWNGGGSNFGNALKEDDILSNNFVFAIADSDKHFPDDRYGDTAKSIFFLGHNRYSADYYVLKYVQEAENLIPYKYIINNNDSISQIVEYDLSYFDFKEGFKYQILYDKKCRNYWKRNFASLNLPWDEIEDLASKNSKSSYFDEVYKRKPLISGCGSNLLESFLNTYNWETIAKNDLTENQRNDWHQIGKKVFSWTCCSRNKV